MSRKRRTRLPRLVERLALAADGENVFVGGAGLGGATVGNRLFGGLVAAQAAVAAARTVPERRLHSLHALFLRPGRAEQDLRFEVEHSKSGRVYHSRLVRAWQGDELVFECQASFARAEHGVAHQDPMPDAPDPDQCRNRDELRGRDNWREMPIDVRMCDPVTADAPLPPTQRLWLRANGQVPDDALIHQALLIYASDRSLLDTAWRPHADCGELVGASLDHTVWFHAPVRFDTWHLYVMHSPAAAEGRGLALGAIYSRSGQRVASIAQEGVLRVAARRSP